jgi:fucose 4-O-acetylase-like acetyltransferase
LESKNLTISVVRGIAIFLVVCGHVIQRTMLPHGEDFFLNPLFKLIYTFHMPVFFFVSGYVMAFSLNRRSIEENFKGRIQTLLVPFIAWSLLAMLSVGLLNVISSGDVSLSYWAEHLAQDLLVNPIIWFLWTLFVSTCLLLLSVQLEKKVGLWAYGVICGVLWLIPFKEYGALYYVQWFYVFYAAGYLWNRYEVKVANGLIRGAIVTMSLFLFVLLASQWTKQDYIYTHHMQFQSSNHIQELIRMLYRYTVGFLGIILIFNLAEYVGRTQLQKIVTTIGIFSLDIFLIQMYIVEGIYPIAVKYWQVTFDFNGPLFLGVYVPVMAMLFIGVCVLISKVFIRSNLRLNKFLLGGR